MLAGLTTHLIAMDPPAVSAMMEAESPYRSALEQVVTRGFLALPARVNLTETDKANKELIQPGIAAQITALSSFVDRNLQTLFTDRGLPQLTNQQYLRAIVLAAKYDMTPKQFIQGATMIAIILSKSSPTPTWTAVFDTWSRALQEMRAVQTLVTTVIQLLTELQVIENPAPLTIYTGAIPASATAVRDDLVKRLARLNTLDPVTLLFCTDTEDNSNHFCQILGLQDYISLRNLNCDKNICSSWFYADDTGELGFIAGCRLRLDDPDPGIDPGILCTYHSMEVVLPVTDTMRETPLLDPLRIEGLYSLQALRL